MVRVILCAAAILVAASAPAQTPPPAPPPSGAATGEKKPGTAQTPAGRQPAESPELPAPPGHTPVAPPTGDGELSLEDWDRADWTLVKPKTALIELDGYLRLRTDLFRRLNFGNGTVTERVPAKEAGAPLQPAPRYLPTDGESANFTGANMRLRVEPTINVTEDIHVVTTFDVLDNLILGSTPGTFTANTAGATPINILDRGQRTQTGAVGDNLVVRRVYARVTALNEQIELRFGRMPSEWGLGMLSNAGNCLDCDYGDVVDRVALTFKAADVVFSPMYDWASSGPVLAPFGRSAGQPIDAVPWDDVEQYSLRIMKLDGPAAVRERVLAGQTVANWGLWGIWRRQHRDLGAAYYEDNKDPDVVEPSLDPASGTVKPLPQERRDANVFTGDGYFKLWSGAVELGLEAAVVLGAINLSLPDPTTAELVRRKVNVFQVGGALEAVYKLRGDYQGTAVSLKAGAASGDSAPGFGALNRANTQFGDIIASEGFDDDLKNFQFSPDYHVDLLLFRHIIGTVTDAWYVRPEVAYSFGNNIGGRLAAVYSQALFRRSTPAGSLRRRVPGLAGENEFTGPRGALPLGIEIDAELAYGLVANPEGGSFKASLTGGMLFPFAGFKNLELADREQQGGNFAWTLQSRLYVTF